MTDFNPSENFFRLLGLPQQFVVDVAALTAAYRELQRSVHPDRYASASDRERLLAVQKSAQINEAFEVLRSPTKRAAYLLKLVGAKSDFSATTFSDSEFLMQQMQLREQLSELAADADPEGALDRLYRAIEHAETEQKDCFQCCYEAGEYDAAGSAYAKLQFLEKLRTEAEQQESELLDY